MTYRDAVHNALQGKCIPYRKATLIKLHELLDMVEPREDVPEINVGDMRKIDTAISVLGMVEAHGVCIEAKDIAVETMRKYQKIQEIYDNWNVDFGVETHGAMHKIGEVLNGNND